MSFASDQARFIPVIVDQKELRLRPLFDANGSRQDPADSHILVVLDASLKNWMALPALLHLERIRQQARLYLSLRLHPVGKIKARSW